MSKRKGGWIKWWKDTASDPRLMATAERLLTVYEIARRTPGGPEPLSKNEQISFLCNAVTGALQTLWCCADEQIRTDNTLDISSQSINAVVHLEGFFDAMPREWLAELDDGRRVILPGYCEKNALIVKKKRAIKSHERVKRYRARHTRVNPDYAASIGNGVTSSVTSDHVTTLHRALYIDKDFKNIDRANTPDSPQQKRQRRRLPLTALPESFALSESMRSFALARTSHCDVDAWFEDFCAHHRAKGSCMHNWEAAWRTWVSRGAAFGYPRKQEAQGAANGLPVLNG